MKKISLSIAFVYTFFVCKEEQQVATQDLKVCSPKLPRRTPRHTEISRPLKGSKMWKLTKSERFYTKNIC
jgi:hypothetical protein